MNEDKLELIAYEGGGCDGCMWEYNYIFNDGGKFTDIKVTGSMGESGRNHYIDCIENDILLITDWNKHILYNYDVYDLNDSTDLTRFTDNEAVDNVKYISIWLNKNGYENLTNSITIPCDICGQETLIIDMIETGYHGIGGIATASNGFACEDCYCNHNCGYCGEFHADLTVDGIPQTYVDDEGHCIWCKPETRDTN